MTRDAVGIIKCREQDSSASDIEKMKGEIRDSRMVCDIS
jgi:hypothetical protein